MKINFVFFGVLVFSLLFGCTESKPRTQMIINLAEANKTEGTVYNINEELIYEVSGEIDTIILDIDRPILLDVELGRFISYVYVKPGDQITMDSVPYTSNYLRDTDTSHLHNQVLLEYGLLIDESRTTYDTRKIVALQPAEYLSQLDKKYNILYDFLGSKKSDAQLDSQFLEGLTLRTHALKYSEQMGYKSYHEYLTKEEVELPDDFLKAVERVDFSDPMIMLYEEGRGFVNQWHSKDINYPDYESVGAFYDAVIASAKNAYGTSIMADYCSLQSISDQVNFGSGIDEASGLIDDFKTTVTNSVFNHKLEKLIEPWELLRSGLDAPDFVAKNRDGESVMLSDLKGKKVYIDIWATWCGPCIAEIPSLKKLEKDLHDKPVEFVSVSIDDEKDREKWKKFVVDRELGGVQLMADNAWQSDLATTYNIQGIPRFLLVDEDGKIVSANAPRPSDPDIVKTILN